VPDENSEKTVRIQGQTLTLVTTRLGPQRIAFSYEFAGSPARVDGTWDGEPPAALPDDTPLAGWKHKGGAPLSVLGAARALPPAGR
jgi:hypothetical protein